MFSINFCSETEKNYLIVEWLFFSSDFLFSLNNLRFIVSLVWNKFTWLHTQFSFKSAHMLIIAFTWLVNIPSHISPRYLNTLTTPQICRVWCPNPAKAQWGLQCYSHYSFLSNIWVKYKLICFKLDVVIVWYQFELSWSVFKVTGIWEGQNLCNHSVVKMHKASQTFEMVDYVGEMTSMEFVSMTNMDHLGTSETVELKQRCATLRCRVLYHY